MNNNDDLDLTSFSKPKSEQLSKANLGLWLLEHKRHLIIVIISLLGVGSLLLYSFFFYNLFDYIRYSKEQRLSMEELSMLNVGVGTTRNAIPLEVLEENFFIHGDSCDFLVKVHNLNNNFFAYLSYCFEDGEDKLACSSDIIFPGEEKYFLIISSKLEKRPTSPKFKTTSLRWERVDIRKYPNWDDYHNLRIDFDISDIKYTRTASTDGTYRDFNNLSFSIRNNSPYNYWELPLSIIMYSRGSIVGINKYRISEFRSKEYRNISITWPNSVSGVDEVKIIPNLNILDEDNYIRYR